MVRWFIEEGQAAQAVRPGGPGRRGHWGPLLAGPGWRLRGDGAARRCGDRPAGHP